MMQKMRTLRLVLGIAAAIVVLNPNRADAHALVLGVKLPPDAPDLLLVEASFDDETPAEGAKITITVADGTVVAEGTTDEKGVCQLTRPGPGKYKATVDSHGHRDAVEFEVAGGGGGEFMGWRPDQVTNLAIGVGGLLGLSAAYWWFRLRAG